MSLIIVLPVAVMYIILALALQNTMRGSKLLFAQILLICVLLVTIGFGLYYAWPSHEPVIELTP